MSMLRLLPSLSLKARPTISVPTTIGKLSTRHPINSRTQPEKKLQDRINKIARIPNRDSVHSVSETVTRNQHNGSAARGTRRIVFVAAPGTEILDLVGPLQVFARAAEMFGKQNPGSPPIYSVEVITTSSHRSFVANCGLRITAHKTFREISGKIDTLLVAGGNAIEQDEINNDVVRWLRKLAGRVRRIGSVCTGAMLLARAGLLDGRRATTHWNWCHVLIKRAPRADVDPNPIFVRDENVYTSAGVTAGMDLALALVDEDHAREVCGTPARRSRSPATRRKSQQHGNDCQRVRLWKRQFDAQRFSARTKNRTGSVSPSFSTPETTNAKIK